MATTNHHDGEIPQPERSADEEGRGLEAELGRKLVDAKGGKVARILWLVFALLAAVGVGVLLGGPASKLLSEITRKNETKESQPQTGSSDAHEEKVKYTCGMHPQIVQDEPGFCPICGMKLTPLKPQKKRHKKLLKGEAACKGKKVLYYQAPMDPKFTSPKPGKSPMGMDLVPVCEGEGEEPEGGISIDPRIEQNMGVRTARVERGRAVKEIRAVGIVDYDERLLSAINTKVEGWVEHLYVDYTGQEVKKGQRLLTLYSPKLVSTQEELLLAYRRYQRTGSQHDKVLWEAARQRLRYWDITTREIEHIEKTGKVRRRLTIFAPFNGVVIQRDVLEGDFVKAGSLLLRIADLSKVWVYVHLYEMDTPFVKEGQDVRVDLPYDPRASLIEGKVDYIFPWLQTKTRALRVRLVFDNSQGILKPGMYVTTYIEADLGRETLLVDDSAVIRSGRRDVVFVKTGPGTYEPREVKLGVQVGEKVEVLEGLHEGEEVVVSGQFMLDSESRLKEALTKFEKPESRAETAVKSETASSKSPKQVSPVEALRKLKQQGCTYTCPMPVHFDVCGKAPGKCPKCGMKLVPVEGLLKKYEKDGGS